MRFFTQRAIFLTLLFSSLAFVGCGSSKKKKTDYNQQAAESAQSNTGSSFEVNGDSDSGSAGSLRTVYFDYNSSLLTRYGKEALESNAEFLLNNKGTSVQIEGHCDERGGVEYNLALGERRARSVKNYLATLGVPTSSLSTISYGKERPVAYGHDEDSWAKNRRANFVIVSK